MTLAEIRELYGVPAEVGMRVHFTPPPLRMVVHGVIVGLCAQIEGNLAVIDNSGVYTTYSYSGDPALMTYWRDGDVIWRPE